MSQDTALVAIPADIDALLAAQPDQALAWRLRMRETLCQAFGEGFAITGFRPALGDADPAYLLERRRVIERLTLRSRLPCETMHAMIISSIEVIPVRLPLREPFVVAYASYPDTLSVLVRIRTRDGAEGWGEATPDPNVTGETWGGTAETLRRDLAPALIGCDARNREAALNALDARVEGVPAAKAALDIALHDLVARAAGMPLWQLLGGRAREALQISRVISMGEPAAMAAAATRHVADGFRTVKVKVGDSADPHLDAQPGRGGARGRRSGDRYQGRCEPGLA